MAATVRSARPARSARAARPSARRLPRRRSAPTACSRATPASSTSRDSAATWSMPGAFAASLRSAAPRASRCCGSTTPTEPIGVWATIDGGCARPESEGPARSLGRAGARSAVADRAGARRRPVDRLSHAARRERPQRRGVRRLVEVDLVGDLDRHLSRCCRRRASPREAARVATPRDDFARAELGAARAYRADALRFGSERRSLRAARR